jgi:replicative DNA helicase
VKSLARELPAQREAEESIIAACLRAESAVEAAVVNIEARHFAFPSNRMIFEAVRELHAEGAPVDEISVARLMQAKHTLGLLTLTGNQGWAPRTGDEREAALEIAGREHLREIALCFTVGNGTRVAYWCRIVRDAWGKRRCIETFTDPMRGAWNGSSPSQVLRAVEDACQSLHSEIVDDGESRVVSAAQSADRALARVQDGVSLEGAVPPPYPFLDKLMPGRLYILGGYAKDGKTDVGIACIERACRAGVETGFVSIEMPEPYVMDRMVSSFGVPYGPLQEGIVADPYRDNWLSALQTIKDWPLSILDDAAADVTDIVRFQKLGHFKFLVIDHLHRISYEEARDPRLRLSANVKQLAKLARTENIPIVLLAQLHRSTAYGDGFPRPTMQSFKETSTIEQEASALWAIYRHRDKETGARMATSDFMVLADRYGEDGNYSMHFDGNYQRFTPLDWRDAA